MLKKNKNFFKKADINGIAGKRHCKIYFWFLVLKLKEKHRLMDIVFFNKSIVTLNVNFIDQFHSFLSTFCVWDAELEFGNGW